MNEKAAQALRAIDRAMKADDPAEIDKELSKAKNLIELLGAQCDQAEARRRYWCTEATKLMQRVDSLRRAPVKIVRVGRNGVLER